MAGITHVLIDANLLTLWIVGQVSEQAVPRFRRTRAYSVQDYRMLANYLRRFAHVVITPNIATETSNLLGALSGDALVKARLLLAAALRIWSEHYVRSNVATSQREYVRLGLTDAAVLMTATRDTEVLTDDLDLYIALSRRGISVTNFTHLRASRWLDR